MADKNSNGNEPAQTSTEDSAAKPFKVESSGFSLGAVPAGRTEADLTIGGTENKLSLVTSGDDDASDEFPKAVINRLVGLKQIQESYESLEIKYKAERIILEQKYHELRKPLYEQRSNVISGEVDVEIEAEEGEDSTADESGVKGIPNFWLQCLVNHPLLGQLVEDEDHAALSSLLNIRVEYNDVYSSFKIFFTFGDNEFFTNKELVKEYEVSPDLLDDKAPALTSVEGTEIDWKPKKNLCSEEQRKKQKGGGSKGGKKGGQVRYVTETVAKASFFHFFSDPHMDDEDDEDEDLPVSAGGRKHEHQLSVDADYEVGHALRTEIVPNAVGWFTGEADDDSDEEGIDLDDDEDEDDDDDDDEDGPDGESAPMGGAAAGNGEQPECKQS